MTDVEYFREKYLGREEYLRLPLEERLLRLSKSQKDRAEELHHKLTLFDLHCHGGSWHPLTSLPQLLNFSKLPDDTNAYVQELRYYTLEAVLKYFKINWQGFKDSGCTGMFLSVGESAERFDRTVISLGFEFAEIEKSPLGKRAYYAQDVMGAKKNGKIAFIADSEANPFGNYLDNVTILYGLGLRQSGLTYGMHNYCGSGNTDPRDAGLSPYGYEIIDRMNKVGMMIDLSHAGKRTAMETIGASRDPVVFSHNGAAALNPTSEVIKKGGLGSKCVKDEGLKALAEKGGVIGIEAVPNALSINKRQGIKDILDHIDYCVNLIGINHVGIGTDITWEYHTAFHRLLFPEKYIAADYMEGAENITEFWPNIIRGLVVRGYSDQEIEKIVGANALRIVQKVIG